MIVWRLSRKRHLDQALGGVGARRFGGRWNSRGVAVMCTAESLELVLLEALVHLDVDSLPEDYWRVCFEVVLAVALHERLKYQSPGLMQVATAFALIWAGLVIASGMVASVGLEAMAALHAKDAAQAVSAWVVIGAVQDGLGGGVEVVGGLWVLLISLAALRSGEIPRALNYVGIVVGVAGLLTIVPMLGELGAVFGLGQILWFAWLGTFMLAARARTTPSPGPA